MMQKLIAAYTNVAIIFHIMTNTIEENLNMIISRKPIKIISLKARTIKRLSNDDFNVSNNYDGRIIDGNHKRSC